MHKSTYITTLWHHQIIQKYITHHYRAHILLVQILSPLKGVSTYLTSKECPSLHMATIFGDRQLLPGD